MAPTLRSSAPTTPNYQPSAAKEPSSTTPRKAYVCSKCKRPRAGHPRSGCPYVDSPTKATAGKNIEDALESMQLQSPSRERDEDTRATIRSRRRSSYAAVLANTQTVLSLDTESQEIVDKFLQPGMFDDNAEGATIADKVANWQETMTPTRSRAKRVKMPGSLNTPSPFSSQECIKVEDEPEVPTSSPIDITATQDDAVQSSPNPPLPSEPASASKSLVRSMSIEEREIFLSSLNSSSDASVYVIPREDIHNIHAGAVKVGFYARIILGKNTNDPQGLLVLGRKEAAVKRLYDKVEIERKKSSGFRAVAGGAIFGAVGAFAGLAFA